MSDVYVYLTELPNGINEMVTPGADDDYTIYINSALSEEKRADAYRHALRHCARNDFGKDDVQSIENEAHEEEERNG